MSDTQPRASKEEIQAIISQIKFKDHTFLLMEKGDWFLIQLSYMESDVTIPNSPPVEQKSRKWYISPYMTESEIVETCWAMVCRSQLHKASEHFTYFGQRVYSQHFHVLDRLSICDVGLFDARIPIQKDK